MCVIKTRGTTESFCFRSNNWQINYISINIKVERHDFLSGSDIRKREGKWFVKRGGHSSCKLDKSSTLIGHTTVSHTHTHTHTANRRASNVMCGHYFRPITLPVLCSEVWTILNSVWELEPWQMWRFVTLWNYTRCWIWMYCVFASTDISWCLGNQAIGAQRTAVNNVWQRARPVITGWFAERTSKISITGVNNSITVDVFV